VNPRLPSRLGKEERTGRGALAHGEGAKQQNPGDDVGDRRNRPSVGGTSDKAVSQPYHRRAEQNRTGDEPDHRKPMLMRNIGRQFSLSILALMITPATIGRRTAEPPRTRPNTMATTGNCYTGESLQQQAGALGYEDGAEPALHETTSYEHGRPDRQTTEHRRQTEARDADQEHPALAEPIAQPPAHDQQHTYRQGVAGAEPLHRRLAAADLAHDGGRGDVGGRRVHQVQDVRDQDNGQD
jgi:hypothetical protein